MTSPWGLNHPLIACASVSSSYVQTRWARCGITIAYSEWKRRTCAGAADEGQTGRNDQIQREKPITWPRLIQTVLHEHEQRPTSQRFQLCPIKAMTCPRLELRLWLRSASGMMPACLSGYTAGRSAQCSQDRLLAQKKPADVTSGRSVWSKTMRSFVLHPLATRPWTHGGRCGSAVAEWIWAAQPARCAVHTYPAVFVQRLTSGKTSALLCYLTRTCNNFEGT